MIVIGFTNKKLGTKAPGPAGWRWLWGALFGLLISTSVLAQDASSVNALQDVSVAALPDDRVQITLTMSRPASKPLTFTIDNPARIALDFAATENQVQQRKQNIGVGVAKSLAVVQANTRTRVVLNLVKMVSYDTRIDGNTVVITLDGGMVSSAARAPAAPAVPAAPVASAAPAAPASPSFVETPVPVTAPPAMPMYRGNRITNVDFRRGEQGEGRVIITLSDSSVPVDTSQESGQVVVDFFDASLPAELERRLDVIDFATPVKSITTRAEGNKVRMTVAALGEYEYLAYQTENLYTIEVKAVSKEEKKRREAARREFKGEKLSLNFQDVEVRAVLQLIAEFTGLNIVVSDTVTGNLTLRLQNVPWDQALDIVLKTKGLAMRKNDTVILIGPSEEIAAREKLELESQAQIEELAPLYSEYIQINYAKAADIADLLKSEDNSLLTEDRGNVTLDERTNTLLVQDTAKKLGEIRELVARLDIPVRQVLIESRIVIANNDFSRDLGVRLGATAIDDYSDGIISATGSASGNNSVVNDAVSNLQNTGQPFPVGLPTLSDRLMVDLPVSNPMGQFAVAILGSDYLLDLELSAMQAEDKGEIVSSPRVITSNQKEATIKDGVEVPYQQATSSGATSVVFREAVLSLKVTPQITPDDRIILDLTVNKDSVGTVFLGVPSINTREVSTQVLVDNGETVVLGGIYEQERSDEADKVPVLGDLPYVGVLFRTTRKVDDKSELLIFVTPKIIKESLGLR